MGTLTFHSVIDFETNLENLSSFIIFEFVFYLPEKTYENLLNPKRTNLFNVSRA
ncbi:hypothetical protein LEP1GSC049_3266 [Leptospira kirschneri serovar Cynopteri str. 3522 CT]|nr:hypothetical protein LEP1GSC044_4013 [Leptospira kirschneri serovar Grippotyphosa str. RM52]EKQ85329.1 hypothetical protein LEP1GSC064_3404 [Leptospira kirschneri serovar Grippotyphosa str. Moskva]EKR07189.1 hypothetical protein LEP1GSC122_0366 [Leptospira kirschneri serovar Valbuzzi str. 200702274]EMK03034.1 hypothetical protein LEP1GSC176_1653 [Leptospira kirschneri str. MMD1493]EPG50366.1 hypothetical protein LEP1GSC049_3266 [Leptospira kirschneri serovar Cynopteri str. 3522 CT]